MLAAARDAGLMIIHTREGHRPDLSDLPPAKLRRGLPSLRIGDQGRYGRILIRGEYGHDIIDGFLVSAAVSLGAAPTGTKPVVQRSALLGGNPRRLPARGERDTGRNDDLGALQRGPRAHG